MSGTGTPSEPLGEAVPNSQKGSWTAFLKAIASFSGDLSSLTAPPFILSPISLTEFPAYWSERPELFSAIADATTDEDRSIAVLKWFISTLKGQYTSRNEKLGSEKKPLNPVLGELFYGYWPDKDGRGRTNLVVEQVSHHPPITAYHISNPSKGLELQGHSAQKTSFSGGSIIVKQIGHAVLTIRSPPSPSSPSPNPGPIIDQFLITLPRLRIDGLWYGSPYIELTESSYIASSTGWLSQIDYKGKGYFGGKSHQFKAQVFPPDPRSGGRGGGGVPVPKRVYEGLWHLTSREVGFGSGSGNGGGWGYGGNGNGNGGGETFFTDVTGPKEEVTMLRESVEEMDEWESRRLWRWVAKGIREGDFESASREKSKIENEQRQRRRDEQANGTSWQLRHFDHIESDPIYEELGKLFKAVPPTEDTYVFRHNGPFDHDPNPSSTS